MNITDKSRFRIETKKIYRCNKEEKEYFLKVYKKTFFGKKWKDYKIRTIKKGNTFNNTKYEFIYKKISFSDIEILEEFFKDYSEEAITYKGFEIYTCCWEAYDLGWNVFYVVTNLKHYVGLNSVTLLGIKSQINNYINNFRIKRLII